MLARLHSVTLEGIEGIICEVEVDVGQSGSSITPWALFTIFVFGPCEPLIPILMYPAATKSGFFGVLMVVLVFGSVTVATMLAAVLIAGATICLCGLAIQFLGL